MSRIALITGATSGIGKATAEAFANNGIDLILCGRRTEVLAELQKYFSEKVNVTTLAFDVRKQSDVAKAIQSLSDNWKKIDILVNNAGNAHGLEPINDGNLEDWDAMIDGNVKGLLYVSKEIMPLMVERQKGHIINISSVAGKYTYPNGAVYCASKSAVEAISEGMRHDLTKHGIKITNIAPGAVETDFSLVRFKGDAERAKKVYEGFEAIQPQDVADTILYAINTPDRVTIADIVLYAKAQSAPTMIHRK
ncbi:short-chain dehydrogenase/reductase SDR [Emticicia oligotrophica DSM 17448]|uniref:Short-chain dehydrogenase/reductase SDR n=1 Tax=Emticicia oligotrophica (strain DSM 17448 / CIP 109782 / MTCC 6937 / GPTSA100-15) TaxID=929562 RepID=A0ABN4AQS4_EMTOG|nr:SDR family NAD(P)-dependent oxidoreductase [Emticicia oligotrophica]AFK04789.1 short-chain dehydrogenase/reductase SDR [Emticicia oligotrophica DSM 17448]